MLTFIEICDSRTCLFHPIQLAWCGQCGCIYPAMLPIHSPVPMVQSTEAGDPIQAELPAVLLKATLVAKAIFSKIGH